MVPEEASTLLFQEKEPCLAHTEELLDLSQKVENDLVEIFDGSQPLLNLLEELTGEKSVCGSGFT